MNMKTTIGALLDQINAKRAEAAIPDDGIPSELPKNIVTEGEEGDEQKVMELLEAIEQGGEVKGAAESIMTAKIAEEMAALDQVIIEKQAEHFGVKMADAFAQRLIDINNPQISEKQAEEMSKCAAEEEYARWFNAGEALFDGYVTKAAEFGTDGGAGIVDNGEEATPSAVNADETAVLAEDLADYLASEFGGGEEGGDDKSASEKQAFKADFAKKIYNYLKGVPGSLKNTPGNIGMGISEKGIKPVHDFLARHPGKVKNRLAGVARDAGTFTRNHSKAVGAGAMGAGALGVGGAGYAGYNKLTSKKQSSDAGDILSAFTKGVITKKQAAEKLLSLGQ